MKIRIEYGDHNDKFEEELPVSGLIIKYPICSENNLKWYLIELDNAVNWEGKSYRHVLIASRWEGHSIDYEDGVSIYILLVPNGDPLITGQNQFSYKTYKLVSWGVSHVED